MRNLKTRTKKARIRIIALSMTLIPMSSARAASEQTVDAADSCRAHFQSKYEQAKCLRHIVNFEVGADHVDLCGKSFSTEHERIVCVTNGNSVSLTKKCVDQGWSAENTLTCMRYLKDGATLRVCKKVMAGEAAVLGCVRSGKEYAQILACEKFSEKQEDREYCLLKEYPVATVEKCRGDRACLDQYVYNRDQQFLAERRQTKRALASEGLEKK